MSAYSEKERQKDFEYFIEHYQDFFEEYGHKFIAIQNQNILGVYDDEITAINETSEKYPLGSLRMQTIFCR